MQRQFSRASNLGPVTMPWTAEEHLTSHKHIVAQTTCGIAWESPFSQKGRTTSAFFNTAEYDMCRYLGKR